MVDMMKDVVNAGSGRSIRDPARGNIPKDLPAAGKTGTTNDATDVWFAGYTPNLLAVVWLGFDLPQSILPNAAGGAYAAPVWADFMRPLYFGDGDEDSASVAVPDTAAAGMDAQGKGPRFPIPEDWPRPEGLVTAVIDRESGKLFSTDFCPPENMMEEIYLPGTQPTELCDLHAPGLFGAPLRGFEQMLPDSLLPDSLRPDSVPPDTLR
jgi:penicillin-binding protein 1A